MVMSPDELQARARGLMSFPVTPLDDDGKLDLPRYRQLVRDMAAQRPGALFVCGGTGEFFSLSLGEYAELVRAAVEEVDGQLPVLAGDGYGTRMAIEFAETAEAAGADGLLLLPPYLLQAEQGGLVEHYRAVAEATPLGLILYQRDNVVFTADTVARLAQLPTVVGFKDGLGDMERLTRISRAVPDDFLIMNGLPTAELSALGFVGIGVNDYSSAVFNFVPEVAWAFYRALTGGDSARVAALLDGFYIPFGQLRDRVRGYAVSLIKAGVGLTGAPVGRPRAPLVAVTPEHERELAEIVEAGRALVDG